MTIYEHLYTRCCVQARAGERACGDGARAVTHVASMAYTHHAIVIEHKSASIV